MRYWLFKSEPDVFGIDHLESMPDGTDHWDGIRNYQARNFMRDDMALGDQGFFYHSSCDEPGIVGTVEVVREAYPDHTALDPESPYYDARHTAEKPRWVMVDVAFRERFAQTLSLGMLRELPALAENALVKKGNRLSILPFTASEWAAVRKLQKMA